MSSLWPDSKIGREEVRDTQADQSPNTETTTPDNPQMVAGPSTSLFTGPVGETVETEHKARPSAPAGGWRQTFSSLANRDFRYLWLGMLFMMGATQMQLLAQAYLTYEITSSPALLALVGSGFAVPLLSLSLFGGAIADRLERRRIIQLSQVAAILTALFVAISITTNTLTWVHLFVVSMFMGGLYAFLMPARQAIIPQIVGQARLTNAMALNAAGMSATTLLAPTAAGILYVVIEPDGLHYVISAMVLIAVLLTTLLPKLSGGAGKGKTSMIRDIGAGLSYIRESPIVLVILVIGLSMALLAWPFRLLMPVFILDVYHRGPEAMGLMISFIGLGSLIGSLSIAVLGNWRRGMLLIAGTIVAGTVLLLVALLPYYLVALGLMVIFGLGEASQRTLNQTLIIEVSEDQYRGRVMSVFMMNYGLMPLGVLPAGIAAEFLGGQVAVGILAVMLLTIAVAILATQRRLRDLR